MKTFSFVGSDKNAGKTTSFNFVVSHLKKTPLCLTSIGINGEFYDALENHQKPAIIIPKDALFVTTPEQLKKHSGTYELVDFLHPPFYSKMFVIAKALSSRPFILEGPNQKAEILILKKYLEERFPEIVFLIDGSIDRLFLGHPSISDAFFFSLLLSQKEKQREKAKELLAPLSFPETDASLKELILTFKKEETKSLLFVNKKLYYEGKESPFFDKELERKIKEPLINETEKKILYLQGALHGNLAKTLAYRKDICVVLDNFTCYQLYSMEGPRLEVFLPPLSLLYPLLVKGIFIKEEQNLHSPLSLPKHIPLFNLYREIPSEITI